MDIFIENVDELIISGFLNDFPFEIDVEYLVSVPFTTIGLIKNTPLYGTGGVKEYILYTNYEGKEVVKKSFIYDFTSESKGVKIKFEWFKLDGAVGCSKEEFKPLNIIDIENIKKSNRKRSITYLQASAYGTPVESYVNNIFHRYFNEVLMFEEGGTDDFENAILNEVDHEYISYLAIVVGDDDWTVKDSILKQITFSYESV